MTEKTEHTAEYLVDPVAFFIALFGGPLLFTLATFWLLFIPVFALVIGGIPYLLLGTPVLMLHLRQAPAKAGEVAMLAMTTLFLAWLPLTLIAMVSLGSESAFAACIILLFGLIFAPCWGASFGWLYTAFARDFYTQPRALWH